MCTFPDAPSPTQHSANAAHPVITGGTRPQTADIIPIPNNPIKDVLIFLFTFNTLENNSDEAIIPTANASSTALPYIADKSK